MALIYCPIDKSEKRTQSKVERERERERKEIEMERYRQTAVF
jgi:hypothetical protein